MTKNLEVTWSVERPERDVVQVHLGERLICEWRWSDRRGWHETVRVFTETIPAEIDDIRRQWTPAHEI